MPKFSPASARGRSISLDILFYRTTGAPLREVRRIGIRVWGGDLLTDTAGLPGRTGELQTLIYRAKSRLFKVTQGLRLLTSGRREFAANFWLPRNADEPVSGELCRVL
jgi:hypothetical protein